MTAKSRRQKDPTKKREPAVPGFPLAKEVEAYEAHLPGWTDREGQFVLIKGRKVLGFYAGYEEALHAGYVQVGSPPFLVKQICQDEPIYTLGGVKI